MLLMGFIYDIKHIKRNPTKNTGTISININCPTSKLIVQHQYYIIIPEVRDSGCRGSIRLVKSVWKNQFAYYIIIKKAENLYSV